jgi:hypothetical protein
MTYQKGQEGLSGIVSCMALNPDRSGMMAAGSYSGAGLLLDTRSREALCLLEGGHDGGLTHVSRSICASGSDLVAVRCRPNNKAACEGAAH